MKLDEEDARELTNVSYRAHLFYLLGKIIGEKRNYGFMTAATMLMHIGAEPDSDEFSKTFEAFTSYGFKGARKIGADQAKDLYIEIYKRLKSHLKGRYDRHWIQRI